MKIWLHHVYDRNVVNGNIFTYDHKARLFLTFRPRPHYTVFKRKRSLLFCSGHGHTTPKTVSENGSIRKRSPEWNDLKKVLFENAVFLNPVNTTLFSNKNGTVLSRIRPIVHTTTPKTMTSPQQHDRAPDHSTVSIQDGGQTFSGGFLVDRDDF